MHTIDELKSLVYGRGRGTGIKITPRHYDGDNGEQILSLARDTAMAVKHPPDKEDVTMVERCADLCAVLDFDADVDSVADALTRYVQSRVKWSGRGAIE
ncbi:hypothetical protein [Roseiconus lacunae]|uniref:Uncharacterized protein n=1 Tax=Roseiconus lacunae TaxID=2605694 RepID=A0ABT7PSK6_9BACT|nr:hypothetical protein [Roseiconus lacunae]MDM4019492.1 hypothetical protein [Roseiconus lacunae]